MMRMTVNVEPDLYAVLTKRAEFNRRSLSGEILYLIECALAEEIEGNQSILRTLMMASGGVNSLLQEQEERHPEQTATDEAQP